MEKNLFYTQHKKGVWAAIVLAVVALAAIITMNILNSQPKSITDEIKLSYEGYDGEGTATYNRSKVNDAITDIVLKKVGINKKRITSAEDGVELLEAAMADSRMAKKAAKAYDMYSGVHISLSKEDNLKNGDTITVEVKVDDPKTSPIKAEKKQFKVKGLKSFETVTEKDFLAEHPVEIMGFNGYGKVKLEEQASISTYSDYLQVEDDKENLSNGDKVIIKATQYAKNELHDQGKKLEKDEFTIEVKDLKELKDISNLNKAFEKAEKLMKAEYADSSIRKFKKEKLKDYIRYGSEYSIGEDQVFVVTSYKVTETWPDIKEKRVYYRYFGYRYDVKSDGSLNLDSAEEVYTFNNTDKGNFEADLEVDGYKEYKK